MFQEHKPSRVLAYAFPGTASFYRATAYTAITAQEERGGGAATVTALCSPSLAQGEA